ncbi:transketolase family protein [Bacillus sp. Marseille-P3661]|uniref:transketolase family protein n=1 Tax=Bacillus sp. Marseille-P3661 TaxID=1936234 RepID=UPI000C86043F|nr:transketolase C-terminal domain-containing protein [Bacillus sp. Marseille-P3661]
MPQKTAAPPTVLGETLVELGYEYDNLFVLDCDLANSTKVDEFQKVFKDRFLSMGVAEQNMIGTAAGLALTGKIPVASTFAVFASLRASEQIRTSVAYPNLNVKIVTTHSGVGAGTAGATHFSEQDMAVMRAIPNMTVIAPSDAIQTKKLLRLSIKHDGPVYIRLGKGNLPILYCENTNIELGKGIVLKDGKDVTIVATGVMVHRALEIGKKLEEVGVSARVIDIHTVKPIDEELIRKAAIETNAIITMEDHNIYGGLGSAVSEIVAAIASPVKVLRLGIPDIFFGVAETEELWDQAGMSVDAVLNQALQIVNKNDNSSL